MLVPTLGRSLCMLPKVHLPTSGRARILNRVTSVGIRGENGTFIEKRQIFVSHILLRKHLQLSIQKSKEGQEKSRLVNHCYLRMTGAINAAGGERDPKKNPQLAKIIQENVHMLKKVALENFLSSKDKSMIDVVTYLQGPNGLSAAVEISASNSSVAKQCIRSAAKKANIKLDVMSKESGFEIKGIVCVNLPIKENNPSLDEAESLAIEVGAEDFEMNENCLTFYCDKNDTNKVSEALKSLGIEPSLVNIERQPMEVISISEDLRTLFEAFTQELNKIEDRTTYKIVIRSIVTNMV